MGAGEKICVWRGDQWCFVFVCCLPSLFTLLIHLELHHSTDSSFSKIGSSHDLPRNVKRKEMFYLTTHSTHFIYGYIYGRKYFVVCLLTCVVCLFLL